MKITTKTKVSTISLLVSSLLLLGAIFSFGGHASALNVASAGYVASSVNVSAPPRETPVVERMQQEKINQLKRVLISDVEVKVTRLWT